MQLPKAKMRFALVIAHPLGKGNLNEYTYHFVHNLRQKPELIDIILLSDELSEGQHYLARQLSSEPRAATHFVSSRYFSAWNNPSHSNSNQKERARGSAVQYTICLPRQQQNFSSARTNDLCSCASDELENRGITAQPHGYGRPKSARLAVLVSLLKRTQQVDDDGKFVSLREKAAGGILHLTLFDRVFEKRIKLPKLF